jgi:hypothetical protein
VQAATKLAAAESQFDQRQIAQQLLSEDPERRHSALETVRKISPENASKELREALITLLVRLNEITNEARQRQIPLDLVEDPEFIATIQRTVAELKDPLAIPALANALGMFTVIRALADFGEQAAPAVLSIVRNPISHYTAVDDGLRVLRFMVERRDTRPLTQKTLAEIRRAALERLTGEQYFTTLWYAIDLAAVLDDAELRGILEQLARSPDEVLARKVTDSRLIEQTQRRAADRLAGIAALPRPEF